MAEVNKMLTNIQDKKTKEGAKETGNMMQMLQNIDPIQKLMGVWDQGINAALPFKDIMEALGEVFGIWGDAVSEGFAPAMDTIITELTKPEVIDALVEIGVSFADLIVAMLPLIEFLLPAMIWMIKAVANIIIGFINVIIFIINVVIEVINFIADLWGAEDIALMPYYSYVAATGANFMTTGPTSILAGEAGQEHVQITPMGEDSGDGITVNVYAGNVITERDLADTIQQAVDNVIRSNTLLT